MTSTHSILAAMSIWQTFFVIFYVVAAFLLIGIILLQKGRGGGIGSAFGGGAATSAFGAKTGDVFTWITVVLAGVVILTGVLGNYILEPTEVVSAQPALTPVTPPVPVPADQTGDAADVTAEPPADTAGAADRTSDAGAETPAPHAPVDAGEPDDSGQAAEPEVPNDPQPDSEEPSS